MDYSKLSTDTLKMMQSGELDYSKIPTEDLKTIQSSIPRKISPAESLVAQTGQGLIGNLGDEAYGVAKSVYDIASSDKEIGDFGDLYSGNTAQARQYLKETEKNPVSATTGNIVGSFLGPGKFVKGAKSAAALTGLAGFGAGEGLTDSAIQTAIGSALGFGGYKASEKLLKYLTPAAKVASEAPIPGLHQDVADPTRIQKVIDSAADMVDKSAPVRAGVKDAASRLGIDDLPPYLLTKDEMRSKLASTLLEEPTIAGAMERKAMRPILDKISGFGKEISEQASPYSLAETGSVASAGIKKSIAEKLAPAEEIYEGLSPVFKSVPINQSALKGQLTRIDNELGKTDWSGKVGELTKKLRATTENLETLEDLRKFRTQIFKNMTPGASTDNESAVLGKFYDSLTNVRNNSLDRYSKNIKGYDGIKETLQHADSVYREALKEAGEVLPIKNVTRETIRNFLNEPPEKIATALINKGDSRGLMALKEAYPEQFENVRRYMVRDLVERSSPGGNLSERSLMNNLFKLQPEMRSAILGTAESKANDVRTVLGAIPDRVNPSGTDVRASIRDMFRPTKQIESALMRNAVRSEDVSADAIKSLLSGEPGMAWKATKQAVVPPVQSTLKSMVPSPRAATAGASGMLIGGESSRDSNQFPGVTNALKQEKYVGEKQAADDYINSR